jgi:hypothetical protein
MKLELKERRTLRRKLQGLLIGRPCREDRLGRQRENNSKGPAGACPEIAAPHL